jgi:hypothetical protein
VAPGARGKRSSWIGPAALGVLAAALVGGTIVGAVDGRRTYEISNVRLTTVEAFQGSAPAWGVMFDAEWSAFGDPPTQVQPCTVRLIAADGTVLRERGFGLHVGRSDRDVSPPFGFPVSALPGDPDRAEVVCSRRG